MKPTLDLPPAMLANEESFRDPFFARFALRPGPPLTLAPGIVKEYRFPTCYADVRCAIAILTCDRARAKAMLPHPSLEPVKLPRGKAPLILSCYEYRNVMHVRPYNEIAMTLPVTHGRGLAPPVLPLLMDVAQRGYYVFSMPVTSLENQIRGVRLWGLPKVVEEIEIEEHGGRCVTRARDEEGRVYLEVTVPTTGRRRRFDETGHLYSVHEGRLLRSRTSFRGDFAVATRLGRLLGGGGGVPCLSLGDSPRADALRQLAVDPVPFQTRYSPSMNACFDLGAAVASPQGQGESAPPALP